MTNLKRLRTDAGLSQSQFSELTGISVRSIQHYEQGARDINKAQGIILLKFARALKVNIEDIMEIEE